jgi:hypothetical protein
MLIPRSARVRKRAATLIGGLVASARRPVPALLLTLMFALALALTATQAPPARAVILPAQTIDGPSSEIVGFGGVAMAEDGTGGLVYLKRVDGVPHVFVSRYVAGRWLAPIQVDRCRAVSSATEREEEQRREEKGEGCKEPFAASWPRIAAASGGELEVVWATPFATEHERPVEELLGATLGPGSETFSQAMIVDPDIGEGSDASPDLAMSSTGQADVVYRVIQAETSIPLLRPTDVAESVRVAHFDGTRWSNLGEINRDPGISMRAPTVANEPQIAIGPTGNAVVVWQEPEIGDNDVARIWARRIFGQSLDYVMPVSAQSFDGKPIEQEAEAPSVAVSRLGQADVAYRQSAGAGSPLPGPRIFLNTLPNGETVNGVEFAGAIVADNEVAGGQGAHVGRPSVDIGEKEAVRVRLLYDANGTSRVVESTDRGLSSALSLGPPFAGSKPEEAQEESPASVMNPEGGGVSAWPSIDPQGHPVVAVREDFPGGGVQTGLLSGGAGGPVGELSVGRSGLGDGLVAFQQGPVGDAAIVAAQVTAPPEQFIVSLPEGWVKPSACVVKWEPAASANGPLTYTVVLDGHEQPTPSGAYELRLNPRELSGGIHHVQLLATDADGQSTLTPPSTLRVDAQPPTVEITRSDGGYGVTVRVSDKESGVEVKAVRVSFGDGHSAHGRKLLRHRYRHPGVYRVVVQVRDKLGYVGVVREWVKVR